MDMKNNNLKKGKIVVVVVMVSLPDGCGGIGKLAVDVG